MTSLFWMYTGDEPPADATRVDVEAAHAKQFPPPPVLVKLLVLVGLLVLGLVGLLVLVLVWFGLACWPAPGSGASVGSCSRGTAPRGRAPPARAARAARRAAAARTGGGRAAPAGRPKRYSTVLARFWRRAFRFWRTSRSSATVVRVVDCVTCRVAEERTEQADYHSIEIFGLPCAEISIKSAPRPGFRRDLDVGLTSVPNRASVR